MRLLVPVGLVLVVVLVALSGGPVLAQLTTPTDWKWRQNEPAPLASGMKMGPGEWAFVQMPPGWHVTTGPAVLLYPAANGDVAGNYSLESEIFLFPGESAQEYGVFLGGHQIDGTAAPEYSAFVLRRDGQAAVLRRGPGQSALAATWQRHEAIVAGKPGDEPVKNVIRVDVEPQLATLWVNGSKVLTVPRGDIRTEGRIGFSIGKDMNLHITSLNVTRKLAPVPVKASEKK